MRLQDFITIALGCQIPWNVHQRCLSSMRYCSLHHYTPTSESVDFLNTVIGKVLISSFAYPSPSIASFQQEPWLVAAPNCVRTHWSRTWRCRRVKTTALTGRLALIPASRRRLRTVWSEILRCPGIAAAVDVAVVNLSRKWRNRIWWSWAGLSLLVVLTVGGHVLSLAVGTHPKDKRCYSGKHSAPWIHVSGFHLLVTGR